MNEIESNSVTLPNGEAEFIKGIGYLKGTGGHQKDEGMAVASLLDSSDLDNPKAILACSLLYFCGVGVTRNTQTAAEFAHKYLSLEPQGPYVRFCKEIIDGSIGSQNALNMLNSFGPGGSDRLNDFLTSDTPSEQNTVKAKNKKLYTIVGGIGAILVIAVLAIFIPNLGGSLPSNAAPDPSKLFSSDELEQAKQKALTLAGQYRTEARDAAMKEKK
jgi:hypothetical protein